MKKGCLPLLLLLLALSLFVRQHHIRAKELEGFGDEFEEDFEEEIEEVPQTAGVPKKGARAGEAGGESASASGGRSDGSDGSEAEIAKPAAKQADPQLKKPSKDEWDEDEFEGLPSPQRQPQPSAKLKEPMKEPKKPPKKVLLAQTLRKPLTVKDHIPEIIVLIFLVVYGVNYFIGSRTNESIALGWAEKFAAAEGSVFERNFSLLGPGQSNADNEPLMIKEGQGTFKFYASGRRFCDCVLVTLTLKSRQDLLSVIWGLVFPIEDSVKVEVHLEEDAMQPFILAVTRRKAAKSFLKEHKDLKEYCSLLDFSSRKKWPESLAVISDCREAANEILNDVILDELLGDKAYERFAAKHFISMHFTDQYPATVKKLLTFEFSMPAHGHMGDISKLMASVPYFIDSVAKLTLSPIAKAKAEAARDKAQALAKKEELEQQQEEIQRKREERRKAEEAKMTPAALAKKKEKERIKGLKPKAKLIR